ncbi:uncharacterized protein LOC135390510 [Ornithodoros turicata]|uniref:uncharacterized protein LOC135390510 n=1 Tax=Ornithodoros turicata TaxID=34597 RepID=UPI003139BEB9
MEGWDTVKGLLLQGDFLARIDLKDAYMSIPIAESDRPWLCFLSQGSCYQWNVLPFGLCTAPRVFTKLMKPVVAYLRAQGIRLVIYLDDILLMDQSARCLLCSVQLVLNLLRSLGFVVNQEKSHLSPTQKLRFLGFEISTAPLAVALPLEKGMAISRELNILLRPRISARQLAKVIGLLNATSLAVLEAPLYLRSLQFLLLQTLKRGSYESMTTLSSEARRDLSWWSKVLLTCPSRSWCEIPVVQVIQTDSSLQGWGASSNGQVVGHQWTAEQTQLHINELELVAAFLGLKALGGCRSNQSYGEHSFYASQSDRPPAVVLVLGQGSHSASAAHSRGFECGGGPGVPIPVRQQQLEATSVCLPTDQPALGANQDGSVRRSVQLPGTPILQLETGPGGGGGHGRGCFQPTLGKSRSLCLPSIQHGESLPSEDVQVKVLPHTGSPNLAVSALVPVPSALRLPGTSGSTNHPRPAAERKGHDPPTFRSGSTSSGLESNQQSVSHSGLSGAASELIAASWRRGTRLVYDSCWRKWDCWCNERAVNPFSPPLTQVLNFLAHLHSDEHLAYRTINCYRSALSQTIGTCEGYPLGEHPAVSRLLRGVFNLNPPRPRYSTTWPVETVTTYIASLGPNNCLPLRLLTYKLAMLLALSTAGRSADLRLLSLKSVKRQLAGWELTLDGLRKSTRASSDWPSVFVPALPQEPLLCPVLCLESYIERTLPLRGDCSQILLTTQKPFRPASRDTVANWLRRMLGSAGIDTSVFKAHSTRGAATSKAQKEGVSIPEILKVADWSSDTTFNRFYRRNLCSSTSFGVQVLSRVCTRL